MKNWKEERNYRRIKNKDGEIIANIITVDGVDVEVTDEVFLAYSQMNRQERYQEEQRTVCKNRHPSPICMQFGHHPAGVSAPLSRSEAPMPYNWFSTAIL